MKFCLFTEIIHQDKKLDEDERKEMQNHSIIGHDIINETLEKIEDISDDFLDVSTYEKNFEILYRAKKIARSHHERYDGTGYPEGLIGNAIPLEARIVNLIDTFDALCSKRDYKETFSKDYVFKQLVDINGSHKGQFDPIIFIEFLKQYDEFYELRKDVLNCLENVVRDIIYTCKQKGRINLSESKIQEMITKIVVGSGIREDMV